MEKTIPPTPYRKEKARREGRVAVSHDLARALAFWGALAGLWWCARAVPAQAREAWAGEGSWQGMVPLALALVLPATLSAALGVLGTLAQTGGAARRLGNYKPGLRALWSPDAVAALARSVLVMGLLLLALWPVAREALASALGAEDGLAAMASGMRATWNSLLRGAGVLTAVALADALYRVWRHQRELWMTPHELREELREEEGDPQIRRARRRKMRELASQRALSEASRASVLVTNPDHLAVALRYVPGRMRAPRLTAKGAGELALRMIWEARRHGVPVVCNPPLARALYRSVPAGREIPPAFYRAVAELIAAVWRKGKEV